MPVADHIRLLGQRTQRGPVPLGPHRDHLAVGAVHTIAAGYGVVLVGARSELQG